MQKSTTWVGHILGSSFKINWREPVLILHYIEHKINEMCCMLGCYNGDILSNFIERRTFIWVWYLPVYNSLKHRDNLQPRHLCMLVIIHETVTYRGYTDNRIGMPSSPIRPAGAVKTPFNKGNELLPDLHDSVQMFTSQTVTSPKLHVWKYAMNDCLICIGRDAVDSKSYTAGVR